ncbi:hypothetical protein GCM10027090_24930 [Sinomonas soli]
MALTVTVMVGIGEGHAVVAVALGLAEAAFPTEAVGCAEHPVKANALSATAARTFFILPLRSNFPHSLQKAAGGLWECVLGQQIILVFDM